MLVLAWILLLPTGPWPVPLADIKECREIAAKYPGSECKSAKVFVAKSDPAAILNKENKVPQ